MPRPPRELKPNYCYHVTVRCNNREFKLSSHECREVFLYAIKKAQDKFNFKLYALFDNYRSWIASHDITAYIDWATGLKSKLTNAFNEWIPQAGATALNLLLKLRDKYDQWWYFLDHPEIPPDNNLAERSLRLAVTKRKVSGGSRSLSRFGDTASLLTVVQTCRSQQRSVIDFFALALRAYVGHEMAHPSLIPFSAT